jgi:ABC-type antimicrobial peptide transport system permease subunit
MFAIRLLIHPPVRLLLTIGGTALCIVLMLFLLSTYRGVADGSIEYIRNCSPDLWVLQRNANNILRGTSILTAAHGAVLESIPEVKKASPLLLLLSTVKKENLRATVFLAGFNPQSGIGGPPCIVEGRTVEEDNEIVLDKSFARKFQFVIGDTVYIQDDILSVVGITEGTNAFVVQYAFVTLHLAQQLISYPSLVTCYLVTIKQDAAPADVVKAIQDELLGVEVFDHQTFVQNNVHEMETGFLPILYAVAFIGAIVLVIIMSLLLSIMILERRKDFAVLKILGAPKAFLPRLITLQAILILIGASITALTAYFPLVGIVESLFPEITTKTSSLQILSTVIITSVLGLLSSYWSTRRLRKIYLIEAYQ